MNLFYIRYFVELAKEQQYTKAAKNLNITQPSLSHAIHQLEEELGVLLFEKTGRNTPCSGRNEYGITFTHTLLTVQIVWAVSCHDHSISFFNTDELIHVRMKFCTDIAARRNAH